MPDEKLYHVYILASRSRAIYVGMTAFLMNRVCGTALAKPANSPASTEFIVWSTMRFFVALPQRLRAKLK